MAGLSSAGREQLSTIAALRWRIFLNSLRSVRGRLNLLSRSLGALVVTGAALGGAFAVGAASWGIATEKRLEWLAVPFWIILLFWQLFPVMASTLTQTLDASTLLRFPLSYRTYFLIRMVYGSLDIATALGFCWSLGMLVGISAARLSLAPWALLAIAVFVLFNLLLARTIFAWIEHWLSRRRSREVMAVVFLLMMVGFQVIGPALGRYSKRPTPQRLHAITRFAFLERGLPPGLIALSLADAANGREPSGLLLMGVTAAYCLGVLSLLHLRLHEQFRGENPADSGASAAVRERDFAARPGWKLPLFSAPVSAVFEKELRYFSRSGPMLFTLIMPVVMIFVLWGGRKSLLGYQSGFVFPVGAAYCLLIMTNIVYNSFGGDASGTQFFFFSPVSFRQIVAGKNLAQLVVLVLEILILWMGVSFIFTPPKPSYLVLTLAWYLLAAPVNFAAGNLLSVYSPKRIDYSTFGRQRASETTILASLAIQFGVMVMGVLSVLIGIHFKAIWIATLILFVLSVPAIAGYFVVLLRMDRIAMTRREVLAGELARA